MKFDVSVTAGASRPSRNHKSSFTVSRFNVPKWHAVVLLSIVSKRRKNLLCEAVCVICDCNVIPLMHEMHSKTICLGSNKKERKKKSERGRPEQTSKMGNNCFFFFVFFFVNNGPIEREPPFFWVLNSSKM